MRLRRVAADGEPRGTQCAVVPYLVFCLCIKKKPCERSERASGKEGHGDIITIGLNYGWCSFLTRSFASPLSIFLFPPVSLSLAPFE